MTTLDCADPSQLVDKRNESLTALFLRTDDEVLRALRARVGPLRPEATAAPSRRRRGADGSRRGSGHSSHAASSSLGSG